MSTDNVSGYLEVGVNQAGNQRRRMMKWLDVSERVCMTRRIELQEGYKYYTISDDPRLFVELVLYKAPDGWEPYMIQGHSATPFGNSASQTGCCRLLGFKCHSDATFLGARELWRDSSNGLDETSIWEKLEKWHTYFAEQTRQT